MNQKEKAIHDRIKQIEEALLNGREYVESGKHAHWHGFRPLFDKKMREGKELPPHRDWVENVFLKRMEGALKRAEKRLDRVADHRNEVRGLP